MTVREKIEDWKMYPNALGSEAKAAVVVGEVANALGEEIPDEISAAIKKLALRGTMRDIAAAIQRGEERNPDVPPFYDVVDAGAAAAGLSWAEAITTITRHLDAVSPRVGYDPVVGVQPVPCPFSPRLMVVVLQTEVCGIRQDDRLVRPSWELLRPKSAKTSSVHVSGSESTRNGTV